jgi:hypothetical protein
MLLKITTLLLCVAAMAWSADPFVGVWKVDVGKSLYRTGTPPKSTTVTIAESANDEDTTVTIVTGDGAEISYQFKTPIKGGAGTVVHGVGFDAVSAKRISATSRETTFLQGAKEVRTVRTSIAKDGKTLNTTIQGLDAQGKPVMANLISEKQ